MPQLFALVAVLALLEQSPHLGAMRSAQAALVQSVDLAVPLAPATFTQGGITQLVYELHITNFSQHDVTLAVLDIIDSDGRLLKQYADAELKSRVTRPGLRNDHATPHLVGPGMRAVINVWLAIPPAVLVRSISHRLELDVMRPDGAVHATVSGGAADVSLVPAPAIDAPLRGGPWIAIYDPLLKGGHRTAIYTVDGHARIPGRYAIDFIRLPAFGALPAVRAADANGFGEEVLAVADGTVTIAVDGVVDATPPPIPLELGSGNHVAIDIGGGRFVFYEHLQHGSVVVKPGQKVTRGEVIARLGSSGSSSIGPHLHFHVSDASNTLAAEGMPFVFRVFTEEGWFGSIDELLSGRKWQPAGSVIGRRDNRPDPVAVIRFP
ncbi:MAG TPA: M23 family metallopeptidase [Vicinamibacterales bacterium]